MFALVDCNNFYASCERLFRPDLRSKPVCVLSNNDGCVIARSNEAKALGIPMGAPAFEWQGVFAKNDVQVFSANFALYGDMSNRVMSILSEFSPGMEVYSIDEIFLCFEGFGLYNLVTYGKGMKATVEKWTGIPVSIGFAPTKALAKVANRIAKKYPQLGGVYSMDSEERRIKALKWLSVGDVWGIGRQHARRLQALGVKTAYDFTQLDDAWIRKNMAVVGVRLKNDLEGKPTLRLEDVAAKKTIATTRSFERNYTELAELQERVATFSVSCSEKLRQQKTDCNSIMVFIHTNGFRTELPQYSRNVVVKLPFPTNSSVEISDFAIQALNRIYKPGYSYKKAGVIVQDLTPTAERQRNMYENSNPRHGTLMSAIDKINGVFGQQKIKLASQDLKRVWKMNQERLSPRYTTRLSEILTVYI